MRSQDQNPAEVGSVGRVRAEGSRANALKHGLTSKKLLPKALRGARVEDFRERLRRELKPNNTVETVLVDEMARHAAMLEFSEQTEGAVLRHGATELASLLAVNASDSDDNEDAVLSAAVATETLDRFCRYRRSHERGFFTAYQRFRECRELQNASIDEASPEASVAQFDSESQCAEWLQRRLDRPTWRCSRCGSHGGCWLASRERWQCAACKHQHGLRSGTVMARSRLPLVSWFVAIRTVLATPEVRPVELAERIGLRRQKTVRSMITKIQDALASNQASELLAGLWIPAELGASERRVLPNEQGRG